MYACSKVLFLGFGVLVLPCIGCGGSSLCHVSGTATYDGTPIAEGSISLEPADGHGPTSGGNIRDGRYEASGVVPGKKTVRIVGFRKTGKKLQRARTGPQTPNTTVEQVEAFIPEIYNSRSTLSCDVLGNGQNHFDFDLKSH